MKRVDHVGIVVDDLQVARMFITEVLGFEFETEVLLPERQVTAAFFTLGGTRVELIEVGEPKARRERLGEGKKARIEHIAIEVEDVITEIASLRAKGVLTSRPDVTVIGANRNFFTDPETSDGVAYQIFDRQADGSVPLA